MPINKVVPKQKAEFNQLATQPFQDKQWEKFKKRAWKIAKPTLIEWQNKLNLFCKKKAFQVDKAVKQIASLYAKPVPKRKMIVNLNYCPEKDREFGEPVVQGGKSLIFNKKVGDIIYFVSERTILPTDTKRDVEEMVADTLSRIVHEAEHGFFQDQDFKDLIHKAEQVPKINKMLDKIIPTQAHYTQFTSELITSYLDAYVQALLQQKVKSANKNTDKHFKFVVNRKDFGEVLEKTIRSDVEIWKGNGPRTELRIAWQNRLGSLPKGHEVKQAKRKPATQKNNKNLSVYKLGRSLGLDLINKYLTEGKRMDIQFIKRVYKMVDNIIYNKLR